MTLPLRDPSLLKDQCLIGGAWIGSPEIDVTDPASGAKIAAVPNYGADETRQAIEAAEAALPGWRERTAAQRSQILRRWYQAILDAADDLALILSSEQGKPIAEARGEIIYAASFIEWFAEEAKRTYGEVIPSPRTDARIVVIQQPVGVTLPEFDP